jgi:hypothetical protein
MWKAWLVALVVVLAMVVIVQWVRLGGLRHESKALSAQLESQKNVLDGRLRAYFEAYARTFFADCDWIRHGHVFETNRELARQIDDLQTGLPAFVGRLRDMLSAARSEVDKFKLQDTPSHVVVVDRGWVERLVATESDRMDRAGAKFFAGDGRARSSYVHASELDEGLGRLWGDLGTACRDEVFTGLIPNHVVAAIAKSGFSLKRAVESLSVFLPLDPEAAMRGQHVVFGPDEAYLREELAGGPLYTTIVPASDPERVMLWRIVNDIKVK